jgi:glutamine amidotransferase-like uncharacterized protein
MRVLPVTAATLFQAATAGIYRAAAAEDPAHATTRRSRPLALVYRGPASSLGCPESAAALLASSPMRFQVRYCGPHEELPLAAASLAKAQLYVQPGGGNDLDAAWRAVRSFGNPLREWLHNGGHYLGICMGAYLAGRDPGWGLLPCGTAEYVGSPGATVRSTDDTVVGVRWRGRRRHMYFQDGPYFVLNRHPNVQVLATYDTGQPAAVVAPYGSGRVGVVGPHPEADASWYAEYDLRNPDGVRFDLGHDLVQTLCR